jgi:hypothetical protein
LMLPKKNVTEEDLKATEARLSGSYSDLKQALFNLPSDAVRPVTDTVRSHPYASVAAAAGAGYLAFRLLDVLMPRTKVITREVSVQPEIEIKEVAKEKEKRSLASRLLSEAVALALPYITGYVQSEVSRLLSKPRDGEKMAAEPEKVT